MADPSVPWHLTAEGDWEPRAAGDGELLGRPLSRRFTHYLTQAEAGWTHQQKLAQLEEIDPRAARAWDLRAEGTAAIAAELGCSQRTAQRLLAGARAFLFPDGQAPAELDFLAREVRTLMSYQWSQAQIAEHLGISIDQVKKAGSRARHRQ